MFNNFCFSTNENNIITLYKNCILLIIHLQIHTGINVNKGVNNTCCLFEEQIPQLLLC